MKKRIIAFKRRTHAGGKYIDANVPVAEIHSDVPWDSLVQGMLTDALVEVGSEESDVQLPVQQSPEEPEPGDEVTLDGGTEGEVASKEESQPEIPQASESDTGLKDAGLTDTLADKLALNGIATVEQLGEFLANGSDLGELEDVGPARAKRILGWWEKRTA